MSGLLHGVGRGCWSSPRRRTQSYRQEHLRNRIGPVYVSAPDEEGQAGHSLPTVVSLPTTATPTCGLPLHRPALCARCQRVVCCSVHMAPKRCCLVFLLRFGIIIDWCWILLSSVVANWGFAWAGGFEGFSLKITRFRG